MEATCSRLQSQELAEARISSVWIKSICNLINYFIVLTGIFHVTFESCSFSYQLIATWNNLLRISYPPAWKSWGRNVQVHLQFPTRAKKERFRVQIRFQRRDNFFMQLAHGPSWCLPPWPAKAHLWVPVLLFSSKPTNSQIWGIWGVIKWQAAAFESHCLCSQTISR